MSLYANAPPDGMSVCEWLLDIEAHFAQDGLLLRYITLNRQLFEELFREMGQIGTHRGGTPESDYVSMSFKSGVVRAWPDDGIGMTTRFVVCARER